MTGAVAACPVCGERLASTKSACSECGAVLALRLADAARRRLPEAVRPHVEHLYGRTRSIASAARTALVERRRGAGAVAALVVTIAMFAVLVTVILGPGNTPLRRSVVTTGELRPSNRTAPETQPPSPPRASPRHASAPPATDRSSLGLGNPIALAVGVMALGAMFGTIGVVTRRRRTPRRPWIVSSAAVAAAFCCGVAAALIVVAAVDQQRLFASAVPAAGDPQSVDAWRREAYTLKDALTMLKARVASLGSTQAAGEAPAGSQPASARLPGQHDEERAVATTSTSPAEDAASTSPTADILRPPRVAATTLGDRVWSDILRDWERVKRTVRELVGLD